MPRRRPTLSLAAALLLLTLGSAIAGAGLEAAAGSAPAPPAAPPLTALPGFFPLEELGLVPRENLSVEINLSGAMLRLLGRVTAAEDDEFARVVSGLEAIRVRVAPLGGSDRQRARARIAEGSRWLEQRQWQTVLRSRDEDEEVAIYLREIDGQTVGLTVLALDAEEITVVNILGDIDLAALGGLTESLDLPALVDPDRAED